MTLSAGARADQTPTTLRQPDVLSTLTRNTLRRSPVVAGVLIAFVALAAMLASAAGALIVNATGASASLMEQARTPHFLQMHAGDLDEVRLAGFAESNDLVDLWAVSPMLNVDGAIIRITGEGTDTTLAAGLQDNSFVVQGREFDFPLDTEGRVISPDAGTVWVPLYYQQQLDLDVGQTLTVTGPEGDTSLNIAGFLRDSQMNASYASSKRLLVSQTDLDTMRASLGEAGSTEYLIMFRLADVGDLGAFETQYREAGLEANGPTITWRLFTLINSLSAGITAAIVTLVTLLLVGIAFLCVRFTLLTTIEQDYREIGVLKAIGVRNDDLNRLYSRRYLAMAAAGALVGLIASIGLASVLLRDIRLYMGPSGRALPGFLVGVLLSAAVVGLIMASVRRTLRRLAKVSPVQALRTGATAPQTRHRPRRPSITREPAGHQHRTRPGRRAAPSRSVCAAPGDLHPGGLHRHRPAEPAPHGDPAGLHHVHGGRGQ